MKVNCAYVNIMDRFIGALWLWFLFGSINWTSKYENDVTVWCAPFRKEIATMSSLTYDHPHLNINTMAVVP